MSEARSPIFIGGTGRSGTSIMARIIGSHPDVALPTHELKIIVECYGLRDLVNSLSDGFDTKGNHRAIENFLWWASVLERRGFQSAFLRKLSKALSFERRIALAKALPFAKFTLHAPGKGFGREHWKACIGRFKDRIAAFADVEGMFDSEGVIRPFYTAGLLNRPELLEAARTLLDELYAPVLSKTGARRWCDDTPMNASRSTFLAELYPDMRLVHMVRNPIDVVASYREQRWATSSLERELVRLSAMYEMILREEEMVAKNALRVRLEDLVYNTDQTFDRLSEHLELDLHRATFQRDKLSDRSIGRGYRSFSGADLELIEHYLGGYVDKLGYRN